MKISQLKRGFTLIELLVVIAIIAILPQVNYTVTYGLSEAVLGRQTGPWELIPRPIPMTLAAMPAPQ